MFQTEYERDLESNYLILYSDDEEAYDFFQVKMLEENKISGFLDCKIRTVDDQEKFFYEISLKQSLEKLYAKAKMNYDVLSHILSGIAVAVHSTKEYLLDAGHLILHQDYIYMNPETKKLYLCFYPKHRMEPKKTFLELAEYLLDHVDHKDEKAVLLAYHFFRKVREENFNICTVMQDFMMTKQESPTTEDKECKKSISKGGKGSKRNDAAGTPLFIAGVTILLMLIAALLYLQFGQKELPFIKGMTYQVMVALFGIVGGVVAFIGFLVANRIHREVYNRKKGFGIDTDFQK